MSDYRSSSVDVLRPALFNRLRRLLGTVRVINQGEDYQGHYVLDNSVASLSEPGQRLETDQWGETYVACCPFCSDERFRLYVNHRWGLLDEVTQTRNLWMVKCHRRDCFRTFDARLRLADMIFEEMSFSFGKDVLLPAHKESRPVQAELPGQLLRVNTLDIDHPARVYLVSRGFDVEELSTLRRVSYCPRASFRFQPAEARLIIPAYLRGELVGWQARILQAEAVSKKCPKYYTMPGMQKSKMLYGYDQAARYPFVVICEGPTDVWRFGPEAVALFGKTMSARQRDLIAATPRWQNGCAVVLLDADARAEACRIVDALTGRVRRVLRVSLPAGYDPADYARDRLRADIFAAARSRGVDLEKLGDTREQLDRQAVPGTDISGHASAGA